MLGQTWKLNGNSLVVDLKEISQYIFSVTKIKVFLSVYKSWIYIPWDTRTQSLALRALKIKI